MANLLSNGQYVHLPSLVQILGILLLASCGCSGKSISALVNISLRLGSLLYPKISGLGNKCPQSWLLDVIFQLHIMSFFNVWVLWVLVGDHNWGFSGFPWFDV